MPMDRDPNEPGGRPEGPRVGAEGRASLPSGVSELLKVMAHDLRNPLSALVTNLHFLQGAAAALDGDSRDALSDSVSLCEVLERLIANLDIMARGEQERPRTRFPTSLHQVAQNVVHRHKHHALSAGLELSVADGSDAEVLALVEKEMFARAAENLVANALEHAPSGSCVRVSVGLFGSEAAFAVIDSAAAVPAELRTQAVSVAGQARGLRRAESRYGRGLGLLCADLAARAAGARLELDGSAAESVLRLVAPVG
jgi:K+-sensing histidine kinase KdpD